MTNSRNKGASFERAIAAELFLLTGISFKRDLEQTREAEHSDLIPSDPAFPFALELKRYASGNGCRPAWREQACAAAEASGKIPCVVFKYDRLPIRVAVPFIAFGGHEVEQWAEITLDGLAYLAREIMADQAITTAGASE